MKASYRCWAEVDLDALRGNLAWIRHKAGPKVKILSVVKADAYGHGLKQIAALLMQSGTDIFGVANLAEAQAIRSVGKGWPILMLGACLPQEVETAVRDDVQPTISSLSEAKAFSDCATRRQTIVHAHVKIDTGMGRLGLESTSALDQIRDIQRLPALSLTGIYTHYASAEDDPRFSRQQAARFGRVLEQLRKARIRIPMVHANNSAALLHQRQTMFNLVRPGLLVYGVSPPSIRKEHSAFMNKLVPALSLKCRVSLVRSISKGASVSYGRTFVARKPMRVAALTAGYGDGYLRAGSNKARVLIGGQRCRVLGRITMDQTLVDISSVRNVNPGDEAVLIGRQNDEVVTAGELAGWCSTVPWEILTAITYRVPRLYRGSHAA